MTRRIRSRWTRAVVGALVGVAVSATAAATPATAASTSAAGTTVTTTVSGSSVTFALTGIPPGVVNVAINDGPTKIADAPPASFPITVTEDVGTHSYAVTGWPTQPGGGGAPLMSLTTDASVTDAASGSPPPSSSSAVTTTVSGASVSFALSGIPAGVVNVAINEGPTKVADAPPASFPITIREDVGTHSYAVTGWPTQPGGGGALIVSLATAANVADPAGGPPPPSTGPLGIAPSGRYITDRSAKPLFIVGDSPQGIVGQLRPGQFAVYAATRRVEGFNAMYIDAVAADYTGGRPDGRAADGTAPFTVGTGPASYDLSTPNDAYFDILDRYVSIAIANGMVPIINPIETGLHPDAPATSWMTGLRNNGVFKAYSFGRYLGARYAGRVLWWLGNDFETWNVSSDDALVTAVSDGIGSTDPTGLQTIELNFEVNNVVTASSSRDDPNWDSRVDVNGVYTYNPTYAEMLDSYAKLPAKPLMFLEGEYENQRFGIGQTGTPFVIRRQNWWAATSGAVALMYSDYSFVNSTAASYLASAAATPGSRELGYLASFLRSLSWPTLVPDTGHTFLTGGLGTFVSGGDPDRSDYATAAVTPDGTGVAYVPTARAITVDLTNFGAHPVVQWFDPTTNSFLQLAGPVSGRQSLTTPGTHADGASDWVLVVRRG